MRKILLILLTAFFFRPVCSLAQPFADEIQKFRNDDKVSPPVAGSILFVGSSSFRKWTDVQQYFPGYPIINRGFGGSTFPDLIYYAGDIIIPYHPKQVVIYCGDNDLASSDAITADSVLQRFTVLFGIIRRALPGEPILFVSIKPSPSRAQLKEKMEQANLLIKTYLSVQTNTAFADVCHAMLNPDGSMMKEIYEEDQLHMNAKGYAIWKKVITPYLLK